MREELSRMSEELARGEGVCIGSQRSMERQVARQVSEFLRVVHVIDMCHVNWCTCRRERTPGA